jgi:hypothetical protein
MRRVWLLLALAGCHPSSTTSHPKVSAAAPQVELCKTTEAELRRALGPPTRDGLYHRSKIMSWILGEDQVVQYLAVLVDGRGVVIDQVWNVPTEIPWTPTDQCSAQGTSGSRAE